MPAAIKISEDFITDPSLLSIPVQYQPYLDNVILPHGIIIDRVEKLAEEVCKEYVEEESLVCVCILKGGFRFYCDLVQQMRSCLRHSSNNLVLIFEFLQMQSYINCSSSGAINLLSAESIFSNFKGKNVLIVEDLIDSGATMVKLTADVQKFSPKSLKVVSLLIKRNPSSCGYQPDFAGFEIPNKFIVGYGCDYNEYFRDMDHIASMNEQGKLAYATK